jgi:hypothetical protein
MRGAEDRVAGGASESVSRDNPDAQGAPTQTRAGSKDPASCALWGTPGDALPHKAQLAECFGA